MILGLNTQSFTYPVGIFTAQHKDSIVFPSKQVVVEGSPQAPDVQFSWVESGEINKLVTCYPFFHVALSQVIGIKFQLLLKFCMVARARTESTKILVRILSVARLLTVSSVELQIGCYINGHACCVLQIDEICKPRSRQTLLVPVLLICRLRSVNLLARSVRTSIIGGQAVIWDLRENLFV